MKKLLLFIFISFRGLSLEGQSFADRFTLQIGAAANGPTNLEPGTLSFIFQPSIKINKSLSVAFRHDTHLIQFGESGPKTYRTSNSPNNYLIRDSYLKGLSSFVLIPHVHTHIFNTTILFGCGVGYFNRREIYTKIYSLDDGLLFSEYYPQKESLGYIFSSSVNFEKINAGILWNHIKNAELLRSTNGLASVFINYSIIGGKAGNKNKTEQIDPSILPVFMIGFGIQPMGNMGKYAGALRIYIEPKFTLGNKLSLGFRANSSNAAGVGFDAEATYYFDNGLKWNRTKIMKNVYSRLATAYYYFPKKTGWYFLNIGFGEYLRREIEGFEAEDENGQLLVLPSLSRQKNMGGFFGTGFKTGIFRFSLEYNFTGKNIPDYLAAQMGLEVNFFQN